jgi:hypothetical protein
MYTEISTDERDVAVRFLTEQIDAEYALIHTCKKKSGKYFVSVNTSMEPSDSKSDLTVNA